MFVGVDGICLENGLTTNYPDQAVIHRTMLKQAHRKIVVADNHKIGITATALICPISDVDIFITNKGISDKAFAEFSKSGVEVQKV